MKTRSVSHHHSRISMEIAFPRPFGHYLLLTLLLRAFGYLTGAHFRFLVKDGAGKRHATPWKVMATELYAVKGAFQ